MKLMPEKIKRARIAAKMTFDDLAKQADVSKSVVCMAHNYKYKTSAKTVRRIATALNLSYDYLTDDKQPYLHQACSSQYRKLSNHPANAAGAENRSALRQLRLDKGYSIWELSSATGITRGTLSKLENNQSKTVLSRHLRSLAKLFELSMEQLWEILKLPG